VNLGRELAQIARQRVMELLAINSPSGGGLHSLPPTGHSLNHDKPLSDTLHSGLHAGFSSDGSRAAPPAPWTKRMVQFEPHRDSSKVTVVTEDKPM
jgi:hypothetical protein